MKMLILLIVTSLPANSRAEVDKRCGVDIDCEQMAVCEATVEKCKAEMRRSQVPTCVEEIMLKCDHEGDGQLDLRRPGEEAKVTAALAAISTKADTLPFDPLFETDVAKDLAAKQNLCITGAKWAYHIRAKQNGNWTLSKEYGDSSTCDAARLIDEKNLTSDANCFHKYLGTTQKVKIPIAHFMYRDPGGTTRIGGTAYKDKIYFSSKKVCDAAIKEGFDHSTFIPPLIVKGITSNEEPRFITQCSEEEITICEESQGSVGAAEVKFGK